MASAKRIDIIDAFRGFALAGIVIVHIVEQYAGSALPVEATQGARTGAADYVVDGVIQIFLRGKFFALFSILFGLSFFIQFDNAQKKAIDYRGRYLWRIFLLFIIGYFHQCFYRGDILTIYAMLAPFLILFLPFSNKWLWAGIGIILLGIPRIVVFYLSGDSSILGNPEINPESQRIADYWQVLKYGTLPDVFQSNAVDGFKMKLEYQISVFYRFYLTFAFLLTGIWLGRIRYFERLDEFRKHTRKALIGSLIGFVVFAVLTVLAFSQMGGEFSLDNPWAIVGLHMADLINLCLTIIILTTFVFFYRTPKGQKILNVFKEYGRTALSNYVLQSIIGTSILYGWGLGQIGEWRNVHLFLLALLIVSLQIWISKAWLKHFRFGPFEWLWRSATWLKFVK